MNIQYKNSRHESGFAHVAIIVIIIIVILAGLGYVFWQTLTKQRPAQSSSASTNQRGEAVTSNQVVPIKEYGIKITLPASSPTISYKIDSGSGDDDLRLYAATAISPGYPCQDRQTGNFMSLVANPKERLQELGIDTSTGYTLVGDTYWSAGLGDPCHDAAVNDLIHQVVKGISAL